MCYISTNFLTLVVPYQRWFGSFLSLVNESSLYLSDFRWFSMTIITLEASYSPSVTHAVLYHHWWLYTGFISGSASVIWLWLFLISIAANANSDNSLLTLLLWLWWFPYQHCWLYWTRSAWMILIIPNQHWWLWEFPNSFGDSDSSLPALVTLIVSYQHSIGDSDSSLPALVTLRVPYQLWWLW